MTAAGLFPIVAVGEHLGYLLTGAWTTLAGIALMTESEWLGALGILCGAALMVCSLEFVGRSSGWTVAEKLTPPAYVRLVAVADRHRRRAALARDRG